MVSYAKYVKEAMRRADYEKMEDGSWFATIPGFGGLWACGRSIEDARDELFTALEGWLLMNAYVSQLPTPELDGMVLGPPERVSE